VTDPSQFHGGAEGPNVVYAHIDANADGNGEPQRGQENASANLVAAADRSGFSENEVTQELDELEQNDTE
jgi:hypothetical protein